MAGMRTFPSTLIIAFKKRRRMVKTLVRLLKLAHWGQPIDRVVGFHKKDSVSIFPRLYACANVPIQSTKKLYPIAMQLRLCDNTIFKVYM